MEHKRKDYELIGKYLLGELNETERHIFEERRQEKTFQQAISVERDVFRAIEIEGDRTLKSMLQEEERRFAVTPPMENGKIRNLRGRWLGLIAAAAVLLAAVYVGVQWLDNPSPEELFAQHFQPLESTAGIRGKDAGLEGYAFSNYQDGNYAEAIQQFDILLTQEYRPGLEFYKANALLASDRAAEALPIFQKLEQQPDIDFATDNTWCLALTLLKLGRLEEAKEKLQTVVTKSGKMYKKEEAVKLLKSL